MQYVTFTRLYILRNKLNNKDDLYTAFWKPNFWRHHEYFRVEWGGVGLDQYFACDRRVGTGLSGNLAG